MKVNKKSLNIRCKAERKEDIEYKDEKEGQEKEERKRMIIKHFCRL